MPGTIVLVMRGPIAPADIPHLCERVRLLLEATDAGLIVCDAEDLAHPDAVTVDALARMQLTARRVGGRVRVLRACDELRDLLGVMGLSDVVPLYAGLPVERQGQAEEREQGRGIEKEADPDDPSV